MSETLRTLPELNISEPIESIFARTNHIFNPNFIGSFLCAELVDGLAGSPVTHLPTDGGGVYSQINTEIPEFLKATIDNLSTEIAEASGREFDRGDPSEQEILIYQEGASLSEHRDNDGNSLTKIILTLSGSAVFMLGSEPFTVNAGDLMVLRGREFSSELTPLHSTVGNSGRHILIALPNYL